MSRTIRVVIVDDHLPAREPLAEALACDAAIQLVGFGSTPHEAAALLANASVDIVLLSYSQGSCLGRPLVAWLAGQPRKPRIVLLTNTLAPIEDVAWFLRRGVGAICASMRPAVELGEIIRMVAAGGKWLEPPFLAAFLAAVTRRSLASRLPSFDAAERQTLMLLSAEEHAPSWRDAPPCRRAAPPRGGGQQCSRPRRYAHCACRDDLLITYLRVQSESRRAPDTEAVDRSRRAFLEHCAEHQCIAERESACLD